MINRILIRIKVVQMLYSYLLTRKEFKIETAPESASRDKRYAYMLYLDLILLILELSGYEVKNEGRKSPISALGNSNGLSSMKIAKSLYNYDEIKGLITRGTSHIDDFDDIVLYLHTVITSSAAYRDYKKIKQPEIKDDVSFWAKILNTTLKSDSKLEQVLRKNSLFTNSGYEQAINMLTETLLNYSDSKITLSSAQNALQCSLDKGYELYHSVLLLMVQITKMQRGRIEASKAKFLPTYEELNPNMKFADNMFISSLESNKDMNSYLSVNPITWENDTVLVKNLLDKILSSDIYAEYMSTKESDYKSDCEFWRKIFKSIILPSEDLAEVLEAKSVYWNDDLDIMGTFAVKTIKQFSNSNGDKDVDLLPQFKDNEDAQFGQQLFNATVTNADYYKELIDRFVDDRQWDSERLAFMDIVIIMAAIAELTHFPMIPIPVTLNEYIEIANCYSTHKSGQFINGILFSIINYLKNEGKLNKI